MTEEYFNSLVKYLSTHGFIVKVNRVYIDWRPDGFNTYYNYNEAIVTGHGVFAKFCDTLKSSHLKLNGCIAIDTVKSFDRWTTAPLFIKLPCRFRTIRKNLLRKDLYKASKSFEELEPID